MHMLSQYLLVYQWWKFSVTVSVNFWCLELSFDFDLFDIPLGRSLGLYLGVQGLNFHFHRQWKGQY